MSTDAPPTTQYRVGILGSGQLGRMLALSGVPRGWAFRFLTEGSDESVKELGERVLGTPFCPTAVEEFCRDLSVVTYEFENIPHGTVEAVSSRVPVFPPLGALEVCRDRLKEKALCRECGIPVAPYVPVVVNDDLHVASRWDGYPAILKTARLGYDGKGQERVESGTDLLAAWQRLGKVACVLEQRIQFDRELSVAVVRGQDGSSVVYPVTENVHTGGILSLSLAPVASSSVVARAQEYARKVADYFSYVGLLTVECFERNGEVLVNEFAPRVHNSYHWTIEGAVTSQFENHLRAVLGMPLGDSSARGYAAMINLVGRIPPVAQVLAIPGAHIHLYGKASRPGRKVGHVTLVEPTSEALREKCARVRRLYPECPEMPERF